MERENNKNNFSFCIPEIGTWYAIPEEPIDLSKSADELVNNIFNCKFVFASDTFLKMTGKEELMGQPLFSCFPISEYRECIEEGLKPNNNTFYRIRNNAQEGQTEYYLDAFSLITDNEKIAGILGSRVNFTNMAIDREERIETNEKFKYIFYNHPEALAFIDTYGNILDINSRFTELFGYFLEEAKGKQIDKLITPDRLRKEGENLNNITIKTGYLNFETIRRRKNGSEFPVTVSTAPVIINGEVTGAIQMYTDITQRKKLEEEIRTLAICDSLTGLYNRLALSNRFDLARARAERTGEKFAILFIDLYEFKFINDTLGHETGDKILRKVASILKKNTRKADTLSRFGGDEFVILIENISSIESIVAMVIKILSLFKQPVTVDNKDLEIALNIGISVYPDNGNDLGELLRKADIGMYSAKTKGPNTFEFYSGSAEIMRKTLEEEMKISEIHFRTIFERAPIGMCLIERNGKIFKVNPTMLEMLHLKEEKVLYRSLEEFVAPADRKKLFQMGWGILKNKNLTIAKEIQFITSKDVVYANVSVSPVKDVKGHINYFVIMIDNITEQKRNEKLQGALYKISKTAEKARTLPDLYKSIHKILNKLMPAKNFYIALYDKDSNTLSFPYFIDEYDSPPPPKKCDKGATEYIIRTGKPLLADPSKFKKLENMGEIEKFGTNPESWLGAPLKIKNKVIGTIVVQSYDKNIKYTVKEKRLFEFISREIASVIERKRNEERINKLLESERKRKSELETLQDITLTLVSTTSPDKVFKEILRQVKRVVPHETSNIALIKGDTIHNVYSEGYEKYGVSDLVEKEVQRMDEFPIPWKAVKSKEPLLIKDTLNEPDWKMGNKKMEWLRSHIAVPLIYRDELLGFLRLDSNKPNYFTEEDVEKLKPLANIIAIAIKNAMLLKDIRDYK